MSIDECSLAPCTDCLPACADKHSSKTSAQTIVSVSQFGTTRNPFCGRGPHRPHRRHCRSPVLAAPAPATATFIANRTPCNALDPSTLRSVFQASLCAEFGFPLQQQPFFPVTPTPYNTLAPSPICSVSEVSLCVELCLSLRPPPLLAVNRTRAIP